MFSDALVGDLLSLDEQQEPSVVRRADGSLLLDGAMAINKLK